MFDEDDPPFPMAAPEVPDVEARPQSKPRKSAPATDERGSQMPFSRDAEMALISCLMQDPEKLIARARQSLQPEAFYFEANRFVYEAILDMDEGRIIPEVPVLSDWLRNKGLIDRVGGPARLSELYTFALPNSFDYSRRAVFGKWMLRQAIECCGEGIQAAREHGKEDPAADVGDVLGGMESGIFALLEASRKGQGEEGPVSSSVVVNEVIDHVERLQQNKGRMLGISTGWPDLDRAIGGQGLEPGDVFVNGARPKMGKTNVLCSMVKSIAIDQGVPTLVLSLEMTRRRLWNRIMFGGFDIETSKASSGFLEKKKEGATGDEPGDDDGDLEMTGGMTRGDQGNLARSQRLMGGAKLWVYDRSMNTNDVRAVVRMMVRQHGVRVVALDYLQLVDAVTKIGKSEERHQIAEVMKTIHALAKELKLIFIVLAQANRSAESNPRHEPTAKDYDGGSAIEKFLDYGTFIHRPSRYKKWGDLDEKVQNAFKGIVAPLRAKNPHNWSPPQPVRNGLGQKVKNTDGSDKLEWSPELDWNEHALLLMPLNRNGDEARIWLRFRKEFTRFDSRTPKLWSNNKAERQAGYADKFVGTHPEEQPPETEEGDFFEEG